MAQLNTKTCHPQRSPEFTVIEVKPLDIPNFHLSNINVETKKPQITISEITTLLTNEFHDYLIDEVKDYKLPLPVGIKETSQATKLSNLVKKSISSTILNISETVNALGSPTTSEKSPK